VRGLKILDDVFIHQGFAAKEFQLIALHYGREYR
jgi:hypothetical protein